MSNLADRIYAVRLSIGQAAMEIENVDGADAGTIFDSMTDLDEIESELRALLAERDALREWQITATRLLDEAGTMIPSDESTDCWHRKVDELISPVVHALVLNAVLELNATPAGEDLRVSEGERG